MQRQMLDDSSNSNLWRVLYPTTPTPSLLFTHHQVWSSMSSYRARCSSSHTQQRAVHTTQRRMQRVCHAATGLRVQPTSRQLPGGWWRPAGQGTQLPAPQHPGLHMNCALCVPPLPSLLLVAAAMAMPVLARRVVAPSADADGPLSLSIQELLLQQLLMRPTNAAGSMRSAQPCSQY
jgi:hypothetical protein